MVLLITEIGLLQIIRNKKTGEALKGGERRLNQQLNNALSAGSSALLLKQHKPN